MVEQPKGVFEVSYIQKTDQANFRFCSPFVFARIILIFSLVIWSGGEGTNIVI